MGPHRVLAALLPALVRIALGQTSPNADALRAGTHRTENTENSDVSDDVVYGATIRTAHAIVHTVVRTPELQRPTDLGLLIEQLRERVESSLAPTQAEAERHAGSFAGAMARAVSDSAGCSDTLDDLPEDAYKRARNMARSMARHYHLDAEDLYQDALIAALGAQQRFDPSYGASLLTFLTTRMRGAILDVIRRDYKHLTVDYLDKTHDDGHAKIEIEDVEDGYHHTETTMAVATILDQLSEADRDVLTQRFIDQRPLKQMGADWGISEAGAYRRVDAALIRARELINRPRDTSAEDAARTEAHRAARRKAAARAALATSTATTSASPSVPTTSTPPTTTPTAPTAPTTPTSAPASAPASTGRAPAAQPRPAPSGRRKDSQSWTPVSVKDGVHVCAWCEQPMPEAYAHRRFCSVAHRVAAHRARHRGAA